MTRMLMASSVVVPLLVGYPGTAHSQDARMTRGTIASLSNDSMTLQIADRQMVFAVDSSTHVEARGAGTKMRAATEAGRPGPHLSDLLRVGQSVEVSYADHSGTWHAAHIRAIPKLSADAGGEHSAGTVMSITAGSLTIGGSNGKATFTQAFTIDPKTRVIGKGVGTMASSKGGRIAITDAVAVGDSVGVWYRTAGPDTLHATEVHVTKAQASPSSSK